MGSSIHIDGAALYVFCFLAVFIAFAAVFLCRAYINDMRETERLRSANRRLKEELSRAEDELYKVTFKTPEVEKDV